MLKITLECFETDETRPFSSVVNHISLENRQAELRLAQRFLNEFLLAGGYQVSPWQLKLAQPLEEAGG